MSKWKCGICNSEFDNYQAHGFNGIICCPLCYFKELYKRKKIKNDKAIEYNEHLIRDAKYRLNLGHLKKMKKILKGEENE